MCAAKGFDAVEFDNVDGYANKTGFTLTAADQLAFDRVARGRWRTRAGSAPALEERPRPGRRARRVRFDFAIDEQCAQVQGVRAALTVHPAGKPVFEIEYGLKTTEFCPQAAALGFAAMRKHLSLDAWRQAC